MAELKSIGVGSTAKFFGIMYALIGLVFGLFFFIFTLIASAAVSAIGGGGAMAMIAGMGLFMVIALPIMFGISGVIGGAVMALLYNFVAGRWGGIQYESV